MKLLWLKGHICLSVLLNILRMDFYKLDQSPLFRGLLPSDIEGIMKNIHFRIRRYGPGDLIAQSGEKVSSMMIVTEGGVKGEMTAYSGRVIKIEEVEAPGAVAAAFLFGRKNILPVNVIAIVETEILFIEKTVFLQLLKGNSRVLVNFLDMISNRSQFLSDKIRFLSFKTIKGKLAHYILQQAGESGTSVRLGLTQSSIGDLFGVTRPSVSRALREMEEEGLIAAKGKSVSITDRQGLSELTGN